MKRLDDDSALPDALRTARFRPGGIYDEPGWYDVEYAGYRAEEPFYRLVLAQAVRGRGDEQGAVVEIGAGTGRLAIPFAKDGFVVHGVEPAKAMRALLEKKRAAARVALAVEDATAETFAGPAGRRVDVVLFPFNGVLHLRTREEMLAAFSHVHERLGAGGAFALDCTGPYWNAMLHGAIAWGRTDVRIHPESGRRVLTCDRSTYEPETRRMCIDIRYLVEGERKGVEVVLEQTMWTWQEILGALDASGFARELVFGDVDLSPFDEGCSRLLVCARKR